MATPRDVEENLKTIETIHNITNIYHEIANLKMRQIREGVLKNRKFFEELLGVYQRVKSAYLFSLKKRLKKKRESNFLKAKKEDVIIFLSANQFFYGTLVLDIWTRVLSYIKENKTDIVVVGRTGKHLAESSRLGHKKFYFELSDEKPERKNISAILEFVKNYRKIIVFYGKYKTVLKQEPTMSEISELPSIKASEENVESYLFEPGPEAILEFFEREIIASLFNQCILEHRLARYASRVMAMHKAKENAKELKKKLEFLKNKLKRQLLNKKQIELFAKIQT